MTPSPQLEIERGIPIPGKHLSSLAIARVRAALLKAKPGDSFMIVTPSTEPYRIAAGLNMKITMRKINGEGWRVWRVK